MAPRSTWSGSLSFGLVNVPVKLYTAVSEKDVRFNLLHAGCGSRIQQKRVCAKDGCEVSAEQIVKGFEVEKGKWVTVTPEELASVETKTIAIEAFVDAREIDPVYFASTYWVGPGEHAERPYALLLGAMAKTGKAAIAKVTMRGKEQLCCVRARGGVLALSTLNYADEVNGTADIAPEVPEVSEREMALAERLIESQAASFDPAAYRDEHRAKVLALIERKAAGETVEIAAEKPAAPVIDLAAALEASLAAKPAAKAVAAPAKAAPVAANEPAPAPAPAPKKAPAKRAKKAA